MKLLSPKSIIFYSVLGAITAFIIVPLIRSFLVEYTPTVQILITSGIVIPMYAVITRIARKYL